MNIRINQWSSKFIMNFLSIFQVVRWVNCRSETVFDIPELLPVQNVIKDYGTGI